MEERLTDLEIRLTHQEAAVDELTKTAIDQARQIGTLKERIERLEAAMRESAQSGPEAPEPPPPHY